MAILYSMTQIHEYTDSSIQLNWHTVRPLIPEVIRTYIVPYVPTSLLDKLEQMEEPLVDSVDHYAILLRSMRRCLSNIVVAEATYRTEVSFTSSGLQRIEGTEFKTAYKYQVSNFRKSYLLAGLGELDAFLSYCHQHSTDIPEWNNSSVGLRYQELFIRSGQELNKLIRLKHPEITFLQLQPDIDDIMLLVLPQSLSTAYEVFYERYKSEALTPLEMILLNTVKKFIAYAAMSKAIDRLSISIDGDGIMSIPVDGNSATLDVTASSPSVLRYKAQLEQHAAAYLVKCRTTLNNILAIDNGAHYPLKTNADISTANYLDNSNLKGCFSL